MQTLYISNVTCVLENYNVYALKRSDILIFPLRYCGELKTWSDVSEVKILY